MSVKPIIPSIDSNNNNNNNANKVTVNNNVLTHDVSFGGTNIIVDSMDFIAKGGYAAAFCIQDGLGFIIPRVGGGLIRGCEKKDENGNPVLDENGKKVREYNWALARKELVRELITGPSAFLIPWAALKGINKIASGNNVKLNYIDGFNDVFTDYAAKNIDAVKTGTAQKAEFYQGVFEKVLDESLNKQLSETEKLSNEEIKNYAREFANRQISIEKINADKTLNKKARAQQIKELGGSVEDSFMRLKKNKIGGIVDEMAVSIHSTNGKVKSGNISELVGSLANYFDDAVKNTKNALVNNADAKLADVIKSFTNRRMGTRVLTNLGLFGIVAAFYTQIPKLYNAGLKDNPALKGTAADPLGKNGVQSRKSSVETQGKDVTFTGSSGILEKVGKNVFNSDLAKKISDIFELNGPVISGTAMSVLLYGVCIPSRLFNAQGKYDYGEIAFRDGVSFTTLLFGAKALARIFSDFFTKYTGLALNMKNMEGRSILQKIKDYLNPGDSRHSVLSSKQLNSKYTNIEDYKGGVNGFIEFIEGSKGNIKKALTHDKKVQECVDKILKEFNGKSFADATVQEIKEALKTADKQKTKLISEFYKLFKSENGLLKAAKTCNSTFNFLSTFVLVPSMIIWLTQACKRMTEHRTAKDMAALYPNKTPASAVQGVNIVASNAPTMAGFLKK